MMVRTSFRALQRGGTSADAKVLDPAAGAGVFLVTAFRELVAERWRADGERPNTRALRNILRRQIVGFDINEAALRFAALGLYLISIELDPEPRPVDKLKFDDLRGEVLHRVAAEDDDAGSDIGSLGPIVGDQHRGQYDIVIGNPPWASGTKLRDWALVRKTVARIAAERGIRNETPPLPNEGLDLPFVWRAMEWAKPNGQIAFALHARLLFQQGDGMVDARQALFDAVDVTSIINGVELRQTKVWPEIAAPFCIFIATNRIPGTGAGFRLVSPRLEESLNNAGGMRIDAMNAEIIATRQLSETPEILKILFRGTKSDLGIVERIRTQGHPTLESFWSKAIGTSDRGHLFGSGNGYQKLRPSSRIRQRGDGLPGVDASYLHGLPEITISSLQDILIDPAALNRFFQKRIHDPRETELFKGPLAVVHKSPPAIHGRIQVAVCDQAAVFNETFYGYSTGNYNHGHIFVRYLALILGSKFALWLALVTSGEFGFEREVVEKATLDRIPLPDFTKFTSAQRKEVMSLFEALHARKVSWKVVDGWVAKLYGLSSRDLQVISDTLEFNLPFAANKRKAQDLPSSMEIERFCAVLKKELSPWHERFGSALSVHPLSDISISPWYGISLSTDSSRRLATRVQEWDGLLRAADEVAASEIVLRNSGDGLLVGRLAQRRYWSETQARLLAQRIVWDHIDLLKRHADA